MNRQEKIDAIYEKIADKTLSFGCEVVLEKVFFDFIYLFDKGKKFVLLKNTNEKKTFSDGGRSVYHFTNSEFEEHFKIIGHPVMIGDVLDWIENNLNNGFKKCCKCGADMIYNDGYYCNNDECDNESEPEDLIFINKWDLVINNTYRDERFINNDIFLWKNLREPIEKQSDECIDFVYDLIS